MRESDLRAANIRVEKRLAPSLPATKADPIQIEQVLTNLITNAIHALAASQAERVLTVSTEGNGFLLRVVVADNGPGISPEIISRIFDPFFTTKPPGKGTGMGLSVSQSIIRDHHGEIIVEAGSAGARFSVILPLSRADQAGSGPQASQAERVK
jgi:C4-dicarboxylate-specific signal transduction histidine kinase